MYTGSFLSQTYGPRVLLDLQTQTYRLKFGLLAQLIPDDDQPTHTEEFTFQYVINICVALIFVVRMTLNVYVFFTHL